MEGGKEAFRLTAPSGDVESQANGGTRLYNPFTHRKVKKPISDLAAMMHLIKTSFGSGVLAFPFAIMMAGLYLGAIGCLVLGVIFTHGSHILVRSSQELCRRTMKPQMTFAETAATAFSFGPKSVRRYANFVGKFVALILCGTGIGVSCVYVVFIIDTSNAFIDPCWGLNIADVKSYVPYQLGLGLVLVLLGQVRNLKMLSPFSFLANVCLTCGIILIMVDSIFKIPSGSFEQLSKTSDLKGFSTFFAIALFDMAGIFNVMAIENKMRNPHHFLRSPYLLNISMTFLTVLYATFGIVGYMRFGGSTGSSVLQNLGRTNIGQTVKILFVIAITSSYGLIFHVPLHIISGKVKSLLSERSQVLGETVTRFVMVMFTIMAAILIPKLDLFVTLVGAVFCSTLCLILPAVVETLSCWESHLGKGYWRLWKNGILMALGLYVMVYETYVTGIQIINSFGSYTDGATKVKEICNSTTLNQ